MAKKNIKIMLLIVILVFMFSTPAISMTDESRVKQIKRWYYAIESSVMNLEKKNVQMNEFDMYEAWVEGNAVKKIVLTVGDVWQEKAFFRVEYSFYYHDNQFFFAFVKSEKYASKDRNKIVMTREERFYIDGNRIIKALSRENRAGDTTAATNRKHTDIFKNKKLKDRLFQQAEDALNAIKKHH